jgi:hypothetical protein
MSGQHSGKPWSISRICVDRISKPGVAADKIAGTTVAPALQYRQRDREADQRSDKHPGQDGIAPVAVDRI